MRLHVKLYGEGKPLLILHGFMGMSDNWVSFGKRLADHHKVYIPDLRNHGLSPHSNNFGYDEMLQDIVDLMKDEGLSEISLLGHSMGGKLAMLMCLNLPTVIQKCIIVDIGPEKTQRNPAVHHFQKIMNDLQLSDFRTIGEIDNFLLHELPQKEFRYFILKNIKRNSDGQLSWKFNLRVLTEKVNEISREITFSGSYKRPILFIKGADSNFMQEKDHARIFKLFPQARIVEIKHAGHWVQADAPQELYQVVSEFLACDQD